MRFLKAERVFNGRTFLSGDPTLVLDDSGTLHDILNDNSIEKGRIESLEGILTPGFINSHCHLELSHLRAKIPQHTGLPAFGKQIIQQRNNFRIEEIAEHVKDANTSMWRNGIVVVGDISNGENSFEEKADSKIFYHTFIELIGLDPAVAETVFNQGLVLLQKLEHYNLKGSLAPHAPYSTSKELIEKIADFDFKNDVAFSIHNQESQEETKFFLGEKSGFDDLYKFLNLDISWFKAPKCSSLKSYADVLSAGPSILVHNRVTGPRDIEIVSSNNISWCFCPNANLYIENALPVFEIFKNLSQKICLGTDSLASNTALDLVKEVNTILNATNLFSLGDVLGFMTNNGAEALGIAGNFGNLIQGKNAGLNLITHKSKEIQFIKKII